LSSTYITVIEKSYSYSFHIESSEQKFMIVTKDGHDCIFRIREV